MSEPHRYWISYPPSDPTVAQECMVSCNPKHGYYRDNRDLQVIEAKAYDELKVQSNNQRLYINNVLLTNSSLRDSKSLLESELRIIKNENEWLKKCIKGWKEKLTDKTE